MELNQVVNIREVTQDDLVFILSSSISCLSKYTESFFKGWNHQDIYTYLNHLIIQSLHKLNYSIFIACLNTDSNHIVGYIIADTEKNYIFLQYTKYSYRGLGVQKYLLMPLVIDNTKEIKTAWATKEMLKLKARNKVTVTNQSIVDLITKEN
jgi:hypothetical protein